jgi:branched-chain amino acid transport system substrate-binding protein
MTGIDRRRGLSRRDVIAGAPAVVLAAATLNGPGLAQAQVLGKKEIVIGGTLPQTGAFSAFGRYWVDAYKFWEAELNAKGGLLGSKVRMIIYDDQSDGSTAVSLYTKLITVDSADLLVSTFTIPVLAVMPIAEKYKMILVQGGTNATSIIDKGNYKYTFTTLTPDFAWADPLWDWLKTVPAEKRPKRAAFVQQVNPFMQGVVAGATPKAAAVGIEVVTTETYASDTQDFTAIMMKLKAADVDLLFGAPNYPAGLSMIRTLAEVKYEPKLVYMAAGPTAPAWLKDLGVGTESVFTSTPYWPTLNTPGNQEVVKAMQTKFGYPPTRDSGQAYTPLQVLQTAVEATKTLDQDVLRNYIATHEFSTVSGVMKFGDHGYATAQNYLMQIQQGQQLIVYPTSVKSADPVYPR